MKGLKLRYAAALLGSILIFSASGCSFAELGLDDALRPPKATGDEAEIEQLIENSADGAYTLKYPKSGNYRSAIIMKDLDGDDVSEAVAFFRGKDDVTGVHMLVMSEVEGEWKISGDFVTETTDVDCVEFADLCEGDELEILVGYTTYTPNIGFLSCYSYSDGGTSEIKSTHNYSSFYCGDLDSSGKNEVITLTLYNADNEAKATMLEYNESKHELYAKSSAAMDPSVVKFRHAVFSKLSDGSNGIAVDGSYASEEICTQIIYFNKELAVLRNPLYKEKEKNPTLRTCEIFSNDISGNGEVEIPLAEKLPHSGVDMLKSVADKITLCSFDPTAEKLTPKNNYAANYDYKFKFKLSDSWKDGSFTATNNENGMVFYEWKKKTLGAELFEIKVFDVAAWEQGKETDEYTLIYRDNRYAYTFKNNTDENSRFSITDDEIKTAFSVISDLS